MEVKNKLSLPLTAIFFYFRMNYDKRRRRKWMITVPRYALFCSACVLDHLIYISKKCDDMIFFFVDLNFSLDVLFNFAS
jgi:hypothetical protein